MEHRTPRDIARQGVNVAGALFQVGVTAYASTRIQGVVDEGPRSPVEPALYAFAIWALIFALSLAYVVYQALPVQRANPTLRRIGWWTAPAFVATGLWSLFVPERQFLGAQAMLLAVWGCLAVAFLRVARNAEERRLTRGERWLVVLPLAPFLGWVTAANAVSLHAEAVRRGLVGAEGSPTQLLGAALLLVGGGVAAAVIRAARPGPAQGYLAYAATVAWALVAIVVNQYDVSTVTTVAAVVAALPVAAVLLRRRPRSAGPSLAPAGAR